MDLKQNMQVMHLFDCHTLEITTWNLNYYRAIIMTLPIISSYLGPQPHFQTHGFTKNIHLTSFQLATYGYERTKTNFQMNK